jgi:hypothetical protein
MLFVAPVVTALYPSFGAAPSREQLAGLVHRGLSTTAAILAPIVTVLIVASVPVVALAFGRGNFDAADIDSTATALAWNAPAVIALGWREVVARAFYALGDARRPIAIAAVAMAINVAGDLTLGVRYGISGLAASTTMSFAFAAVASSVLAARPHRALPGRATLAVVIRVGRAALAGGVVAVVVVELTGVATDITRSGAAAALYAAVVAGCVAAVYVTVLTTIGSPELAELKRALGLCAPTVLIAQRSACGFTPFRNRGCRRPIRGSTETPGWTVTLGCPAGPGCRAMVPAREAVATRGCPVRPGCRATVPVGAAAVRPGSPQMAGCQATQAERERVGQATPARQLRPCEPARPAGRRSASPRHGPWPWRLPGRRSPPASARRESTPATTTLELSVPMAGAARGSGRADRRPPGRP